MEVSEAHSIAVGEALAVRARGRDGNVAEQASKARGDGGEGAGGTVNVARHELLKLRKGGATGMIDALAWDARLFVLDTALGELLWFSLHRNGAVRLEGAVDVASLNTALSLAERAEGSRKASAAAKQGKRFSATFAGADADGREAAVELLVECPSEESCQAWLADIKRVSARALGARDGDEQAVGGAGGGGSEAVDDYTDARRPRVNSEGEAATTVRAVFERLPLGLVFQQGRKRAVVQDVKAGSAGAAAGVRVGDELVRVGTLTVANKPYSATEEAIRRECLRIKRGEESEFVFLRSLAATSAADEDSPIKGMKLLRQRQAASPRSPSSPHTAADAPRRRHGRPAAGSKHSGPRSDLHFKIRVLSGHIYPPNVPPQNRGSSIGSLAAAAGEKSRAVSADVKETGEGVAPTAPSTRSAATDSDPADAAASAPPDASRASDAASGLRETRTNGSNDGPRIVEKVVKQTTEQPAEDKTKVSWGTVDVHEHARVLGGCDTVPSNGVDLGIGWDRVDTRSMSVDDFERERELRDGEDEAEKGERPEATNGDSEEAKGTDAQDDSSDEEERFRYHADGQVPSEERKRLLMEHGASLDEVATRLAELEKVRENRRRTALSLTGKKVMDGEDPDEVQRWEEEALKKEAEERAEREAEQQSSGGRRSSASGLDLRRSRRASVNPMAARLAAAKAKGGPDGNKTLERPGLKGSKSKGAASTGAHHNGDGDAVAAARRASVSAVAGMGRPKGAIGGRGRARGRGRGGRGRGRT